MKEKVAEAEEKTKFLVMCQVVLWINPYSSLNIDLRTWVIVFSRVLKNEKGLIYAPTIMWNLLLFWQCSKTLFMAERFFFLLEQFVIGIESVKKLRNFFSPLSKGHTLWVRVEVIPSQTFRMLIESRTPSVSAALTLLLRALKLHIIFSYPIPTSFLSEIFLYNFIPFLFLIFLYYNVHLHYTEGKLNLWTGPIY